MKCPSLLLPLLLAASASGAELLVPADYTTVQGAIEAATDGDVVLISPGTYLEVIDLRGKAITLRGVAGAPKTILHAPPDRSTVYIHSGEGRTTILEHLTITGGAGTPHEGFLSGGGIFFDHASATIRHCTISGNTAVHGAGVHGILANPLFEDCLFSGNVSESTGSATHWNLECFPDLVRCTFSNNHSGAYGAAIGAWTDCVVDIVDCTFENNTAAIRGGAVYSGCGCTAVNISGSTFCTNAPDHVVGEWTNLGGNDFCPSCPADINADGAVNVTDVLSVLAAWGTCSCIEDIDGDGLVNVTDILLVLGDWGICP